MNALMPDLLSAAIDPVRAARLGFVPAYMDMATFRVYVASDAEGRPTLHHCPEGLHPSFVWARDVRGQAIVVKPTLRAGYLRDGFFYTLTSTARALREWDKDEVA